MTIAIILLIVGFCLVVLEVFIPSGGLLTVLAIAFMISSVYFAFAQSQLMGGLFLVIGTVGMPLLAWKLLNFFPSTGVGRRFLLFGPKGHEEVATSTELKLDHFAGKKGVAKSKLRPSGVAEIDGERVSVVSEGMIIEAGTPIEVIEVSGHRVVVKEAEEKKETGQEHVSNT